MVSVSISPRFMNGRLSSPSLATSRPFRDLYCFLKLNFHVRILIAWVASVSVWLRTMKERPRNDEERDFRFLAARKMERELKNEREERVRGRKGFVSKRFLPFFPSPSRSFTCPIFRAVFDSRSAFFAPKPHGNACYAG